MKAFAKQLNVLKVYDDGIDPMENFSGIETYISLKIYQTWGRPVYILDAIYLDYPSGNPSTVQVSILVTHHFMLYPYLWF